MNILTTVCAWCPTDAPPVILSRELVDGPGDADGVSHGICPEHLAKLEAELFAARFTEPHYRKER